MIAPSVMNLPALPAFADNYIWMLDDAAHAIAVDPGEPGPVAEALDARRLGLAAILMTHRRADHLGGAGEGETAHAPDLAIEAFDTPAYTDGHIAFDIHTGAGGLIVVGGATLFSPRAHGAAGESGSEVLAALRTWKNHFR
jgi:hydroxyacylglutathione hydrolase